LFSGAERAADALLPDGQNMSGVVCSALRGELVAHRRCSGDNGSPV